MDPSRLAVIIAAAACSPNPNDRKAAEQSLDQVNSTFILYKRFDFDQTLVNEQSVILLFGNSILQIQHTPQHLIRILQIVVDGGCDPAVRQAACIHFKNFIAKHWDPHSGNLIVSFFFFLIK